MVQVYRKKLRYAGILLMYFYSIKCIFGGCTLGCVYIFGYGYQIMCFGKTLINNHSHLYPTAILADEMGLGKTIQVPAMCLFSFSVIIGLTFLLLKCKIDLL